MLENKTDRVLQIIDSSLSAVSPSIGTAREFSDEQREVCKVALSFLKLSLQDFDSLSVVHNFYISNAKLRDEELEQKKD